MWENYIDEDWNKQPIPTFIVIWDAHMDEVWIWEENEDDKFIYNMYRLQHWKTILIDKDESSKPEINAVSILHEKFWISVIWLENVVNWKKRKWYWILEGLDSRWIDTFWLEEDQKSLELWGRYGDINLFFYLALYEKLWVDLSKIQPITSQNFVELWKKHLNFLGMRFGSAESRSQDAHNELLFSQLEEFENMSIQDLTEIVQCLLYVQNKGQSWDRLEDAIRHVVKLSSHQNLTDIKYGLVENNENRQNHTIDYRTWVAIDFMKKNMKSDKLWAFVVWKWHLLEAKRQLNEMYNWRVNIYFAK